MFNGYKYSHYLLHQGFEFNGRFSCFFEPCSEVLAAEAVACLNKALYYLKDIWEEIGIPEDQRLQRTNVVNNHVKVRQRSKHEAFKRDTFCQVSMGGLLMGAGASVTAGGKTQ